MATIWPKGVKRISINELDRLGIDEKTQRLYWDGEEIVMRTELLLSTAARWIGGIAVSAAGVAAVAASVTAAVNVIRLIMGK